MVLSDLKATLYVTGFACMFSSITHAQIGQKRMLDSQELEF